MSSAIITDTDEEMAKYDEALVIAQNHPPMDAIQNKKIAFNTELGVDEVLYPMQGGGYVKIGEMPKDKTREIKGYAQDLQSMGQPFDIDNFTSAGYTEDEVMAAGVMPQGQEKTGRTDPLTTGEQLLMQRSGSDLAMPRFKGNIPLSNPLGYEFVSGQTKDGEDIGRTLREKDRQFFVENGEGELRQIFEVLGIDRFEARKIAEGIFGNTNATKDFGIGVADFTPLGVFYAAEEGATNYARGRTSGDPLLVAMGALEMGASFLEAIPLTATASKGVRKNLPLLRQRLEEFGETLKERLNQPGEMPTVGSNLGNIKQFKLNPDEVKKVLELRASQMEIPVNQRVQPSNDNMFEVTPQSYNQTFPEQKETPVPRVPEGKTLPLKNRGAAVIEMSDVISDKLAERAKPFVGSNVQYFYHTGPLIDKAVALGIPKEQAQEQLKKFASNYAATSPRTQTEENLRSASIATVKAKRGVDIADIIGPGGDGINEKGYPMMIGRKGELDSKGEPLKSDGIHRKLLEAVQGEGISFNTNPKPATFAENVSGNLAGVTVDTHAIRAVFDVMNELQPGSIPLRFIGGKNAKKTKQFQEMYENDPASFDAATMVADTLGSQKIDGKDVQTEYAIFSDIYKKVANKLGVQPAEAQSLSWFANGDKTGLASEPKTIVELINDRVDVTAQLLNQSKEEVFKKFLQGSLPLLSVGGLTLLETGAARNDEGI